MKMMGVNASSHFIAWFIECAIFLLITVTFLIVVLKVGEILPKTDTALLFLYLMDYSLSIIAMSYFISVFFNNTNIAALVGSLVYILTFFPFIVLLVIENHLSFSVKSLLVSSTSPYSQGLCGGRDLTTLQYTLTVPRDPNTRGLGASLNSISG